MKAQKIIHRFKNTFEKNGFVEEKDNPVFGEADPEKIEYLTDLYGVFHHCTSVYLNDELEVLKKYRVPKHIVEFYSRFEPKRVPMTEAGIHLCDLEGIKKENSSMAPGAILIKYGLVTIATTIGGMAVCMDLDTLENNDPSVVIIDLDDCLSKEDVSSYEDILNIKPPVSPSFQEFLWKPSGDEYEDFEDTFVEAEGSY